MFTERFHRLEQLFEEAWAQPPESRSGFLALTCGDDVAMRDDVSSLITAAAEAGDFLTVPALDVFARRIASEGWSLRPGESVGAYTVERLLGSGGMGEVWRARDARLGRDVAIKVLLPYFSHDADRVGRFQQEARAASALNHTNVLTVYDVGEHSGAPYLVTECLEGQALRTRLAAGKIRVDEAVDVVLQVARGLAAAHGRGIVHRDLKPENIFLVVDGRVKILDFGLAKLQGPAPMTPEPAETQARTRRGAILGTAGYMAPEQVVGGEADPRADVFALGAVLYEMLAGRRAFEGADTFEILNAIMTRRPPDLSGITSEVPPALSEIVQRSLAKSATDRCSTTELVSALESLVRIRQLPPPPSSWTLFRRPGVLVSLLVAVLAIGGAGWRWRTASERARWARTVAAPEIQRLADHDDFVGAFNLANEAREVLPDDPQIRQLWLNVSWPASIESEPSGASVAFKAYRPSSAVWHPLGQTPLENIRLPRGLLRFQFAKAGFAPIEVATNRTASWIRYRLDPPASVPPGMVRVPAGRTQLRLGLSGDVEDYWIDRLEVTNRQYKEFVERGGYRRREYWRMPFVDRGRTVSWEEAVARLHDATGRPGPATWELGTYPEGQADFPVGGVSWYEAAAYAEFAGKSLPTVYHWYRAADVGNFSDIITVSNFSGKGPAAAGSSTGLGPFGTYDMAGNIKEWCWNESGGQRFILGAGWNESAYTFIDYDAQWPLDRRATYGFRLAKYLQPPPDAVTAALRIEGLARDVSKEWPVSDEIFEVYRRQYEYDKGPLNAAIEAREENTFWRKETVALDAAYGGERLRAYLFLPKNVSPPYQTIVYFPPADALRLRSSRDLSLNWVDYIIRSGRAVLFPVYKGTYERGPAVAGVPAQRELRVAWSRDVRKSIDYLETRTDIDRDRLAFYGISLGADAGVIVTVLEPRFKASVLQGTGFWTFWPPEIDTLNFAPRVRVPTLMLNGRYDFENPVETAQRPLFNMLGTSPEHKRHAVFEGGHVPFRPQEFIKEILAWLDRYLGLVAH